jgi:molybdenum cofactor synthesis domain-containing protein
MEKQALHIVSVNISEKKGTVKHPVDKIKLTFEGIEGDAHRNMGHRMVSLLGVESIEKFSHKHKRPVKFGEFAENITTRNLLLYEMHPLDKLYNENVVLEVTQIGKKCHGDDCAIFREVGNCVMPKEGIFARVLKEGYLQAGDILYYEPKIHKAVVITLSTRAYQGVYEDKSGKIIQEQLANYYQKNNYLHEIDYVLIPDDENMLKSTIEKAISNHADIIITTGGTGIGHHDITIETIRPLLSKEIPGIMEFIRMKYGQQKPQALLSRSIAGIVDKTQIYCLPGSSKAAIEYMTEILPHYQHILRMLYEIDEH